MRKTQEALRQAVNANGVRWTAMDQWHVTLRFLGAVPLANVDALIEAIQRGCTGFRSLHCSANGIGCFPHPKSPRVIWAGITDAENRLGNLHRVINSAVGEFTTEKAETEFVGHVTLARVKAISGSEIGILAETLSRLATTPFGEWRADTVELMRSELQPQGAIYSRIAEISLER